jgi:hypothetical protein
MVLCKDQFFAVFFIVMILQKPLLYLALRYSKSYKKVVFIDMFSTIITFVLVKVFILMTRGLCI